MPHAAYITIVDEEAGLDDRSILDIALITASFAFVNRIADGVGAQLEDYREQ